jgi:hypothetical protein
MRMFDAFRSDRILHVLFGRGAGQSVIFFTKLYEGDTTLLGFVPSFIYNYGLIGTALFLLFFLALFPRHKFILTVLFVLFMVNADFNTQIFLFVLFCIMAARQIDKLHAQEAQTVKADDQIIR